MNSTLSKFHTFLSAQLDYKLGNRKQNASKLNLCDYVFFVCIENERYHLSDRDHLIFVLDLDHLASHLCSPFIWVRSLEINRLI